MKPGATEISGFCHVFAVVTSPRADAMSAGQADRGPGEETAALEHTGVVAPPVGRLGVLHPQHLVGLDVDVLHALARRLNVRTQVVPTAWHSLEQGLVDRRYDVILSSWTPSPSTPASI
ncbi:MAG: transporter substrate-binding domain-containing protein, partial [Verrucomicrobia bacterium]|nr:transporter substrate-binding domain-containing protein [Verrucomicrobiota bacterium]